MSMMDTEDITVLEMVADLQLPCDYSEHSFCGHLPAKWIGHVRCPTCNHSSTRLIGSDCKDILMNNEGGLRCPACNEPAIPMRRIFARIEAL
jgi:hypothetical protein